MSSIFTKSFLILLKAVKAARGGKYVHREFVGTSVDKKGKIRNKWKYFYNQGTLQKELAKWKAQFEAKQAKQKKNLFATHADIKGVEHKEKSYTEIIEQPKQTSVARFNGSGVRFRESSVKGQYDARNPHNDREIFAIYERPNGYELKIGSESKGIFKDLKSLNDTIKTKVQDTKDILDMLEREQPKQTSVANPLESFTSENGFTKESLSPTQIKYSIKKDVGGYEGEVFVIDDILTKKFRVGLKSPEPKGNKADTMESKSQVEFFTNMDDAIKRAKFRLNELNIYSQHFIDEEQPTSSQSEPVQAKTFDEHIAHLNLSDSQKKAALDLLNSLKKDTPEFAKTRIERFKTMPGSYRAVGEAVASYFEQGNSLSDAMLESDIKKYSNGISIKTITKNGKVYRKLKLSNLNKSFDMDERIRKLILSGDLKRISNSLNKNKFSKNEFVIPESSYDNVINGLGIVEKKNKANQPKEELSIDDKKVVALEKEFDKDIDSGIDSTSLFNKFKDKANIIKLVYSEKTNRYGFDLFTKDDPNYGIGFIQMVPSKLKDFLSKNYPAQYIELQNYLDNPNKDLMHVGIVKNNFDTMPETKQENNFKTMPESNAIPTGVKIESNGNSQVVKSSSINPDTKEIVYTVENKDGVETNIPESKVKILPITQPVEVKKVIESAEPSNRMAIEKQLIGKPENAISIKDDIAKKNKAPIAYIEKEITTLSGIKIKAIDYSSVPINEIQIIDAETILTTPKPSYIPEINERDFEIKSYFLEFVKAPDGNFIVPLNRYIPKVQRALERDAKGNIAYQNKARDQEPKYAIMSLENIVATTEYYRTKKLEEGRDKAAKNNIANVQKILTWDQKTREYYKPFNYTRLSESQKKKYSEESWNNLSETEKLKEVPKMKNPPIHINPIPRLKIGLKEMSMLVSTFHLYNELVDSSYSIPSRATGYNPKDQVAIDFNSIREDYKQKVEDMKIQKEEDSASYKQALETSFGMSKTKNDLFESHGILVKSQNGKEVNRDQVKDISEAMNLVYSVFGDKKQLSQSANLKISHSGEKYIFASKALGMYIRSMGTIAISNKDSKVNKGFTLAHEFAHFMDNWLGKKNKRNFASDDYNSIAGKIAKTFREKMENLDIATGYHKRTCECFARALEQYFAIKTGNESEYSNQKYYIKDTKYFEETFSPMIEKFLSENEHLLKAFPLFTGRKSNILTLLKGKKAQEGEVRTWGNNKQYKKVGGKWQPVNEGKKKAAPKEKKEKKKKGETKESNTGFSMKPFAEIKRIAQYTKEADFDKEKIEQYKNSIAEHGYDPAFPMVIDKDKKTGAYNVVAGNHRYKAVEALINEGKLPKDFEIPTVMREFEDENARLAYQVRENQRRDPLPTDEANAYKKMADNGWDAARIAKELGQPVGKITKRLALSNLSPDLFNLVSKKGIPVGIAEAIGLGSVEEESGKPNHTIQLKAYQFYRDNKGKGYGAGEVLSFIRELKSNASQKFFENDGKSDTEKEALRSVGSEEKAKRNVKMLDNTFKTMQKALSNLMGDSVGQINPKLAKELSASIVAAQGESEFSNKMKQLDTVIQDMQLMKEAFMKSFKGMKDDSTMGMMFASSINTMIHHVNKHTKAIETAKGINKMLTMAYKAKYKLHDQSVKARLAA